MTDYEIKVQNFRCLNAVARKGETVFVGSSLCELFPISEMLQNVEPRLRVYNRGIGGDVTDGLLERMEESVFALEPKKVFINIGTNDISRPGYTRVRLLAQYRKILEMIIHKFNGGPVGLDTLAAAIGEDAGTIEDVYEPYLIQYGFLNRTPRGRVATELSYHHLGI